MELDQRQPRTTGATLDSPNPGRIFEIGTGFWAAKTLLSAVELGLFTELARGPLDLETLRQRLGLHTRSARDFFDALVALGLLDKQDDRYVNTPVADLFLDREKPSYMGGILEMLNGRLYGFWGSLTEGLRTGRPQNEARWGGNLFTELYADAAQLRAFLYAMAGLSLGSAKALAATFPWSRYGTFVDVGCAQGLLPVEVALSHPHLAGGGFDLPPVGPIFHEYIAARGLRDRLRFFPGDFFVDRLPEADVLVMGHILHDWNVEQRRLLLSMVVGIK